MSPSHLRKRRKHHVMLLTEYDKTSKHHVKQGDRVVSDPPPPSHPASYWLRLFSSQTFSRVNTPTFSNLVILQTYPPMKMEGTECFETSAYKIQTPGNYPEESKQKCYTV
jgi:hypothetical protein